ncbi:polysaccharide deacetylase family protein [Bacillus sp. CGMCC 1.16607]|uniref:polysaccharide deacetylase family protein n=1 Tax=Bacillus sp. CGMCC 1.16607 TaxID=3351842 RepID=UPI003643B96B
MLKKVLSIVSIVVLVGLLVNRPLINNYVLSLKDEAIPVSKIDDSLKREIENQAKKYEIPASDARIDKVWKATPGYNGLKVDIHASYKNMEKQKKFEEKKIVFEQIEPKIHLGDLPPSPIYRGHPDKPAVGFMVNVAWGNEYLSSMLETLKKHNVHATFFLEGRWVQKNPDLAKMIVAAGHEIGNHSFSHPDLKILSSARTREEILQTNKVIKATTDILPKWFAPPSGSYRDETVQIAAEMGMGTVLWSVDTIDWQKPTVETLINRVLKKVHNGALILMHPTESTAKSLDIMILKMKEKNLQIGTVSEVLDEKRLMKNNLNLGENSNNSNR